jgi:DNA helicase-2/ATP-dependent DNA helicase PcrA
VDKRVVFAVAGSGKTSLIVNTLEETSRALIVTYTVRNTHNLKTRIAAKFGHIPKGIRIYTYYNFLYGFCFRPILGHQIRTKGITWNTPPKFAKKDNIRFWADSNSRLYGNRISRLLDATEVVPELLERLEKYADHILIDEVQDFAGNDFNLLRKFNSANITLTLVGDYYQHTFDTSRDGNINSSLHKEYQNYLDKFEGAGYKIDLDTLSSSYRCSPSLCKFVTEKLGIAITSHRDDETEVMLIECPEQAKSIFCDDDVVKLFYNSSEKYPGNSQNWGAVKGEDNYNDVCVVLNPNSLGHFKRGTLHTLAPTSKNKLYVACTRAKRHLYFVSDKLYKDFAKSG